MLRFLLPAFALMGALLVLFAGALSDRVGSYGPAGNAVRVGSGASDRTREQPRADNWQTVPIASQPEPQAAQPQAARDALQHQVQSLQQQATTLQQQLAQRSQELDQRNQELDRRSREIQAAQAEADKLRQGAATLRQQQQADETKERQLAARADELNHRTQELDQRKQQLDQRSHDTEAAQAEADRLRQVIDALRQQSKAEEATLARQKAEDASLTRQKAKQQQLVATAAPQPAAPPKRAEPSTGPTDAGSPAQHLAAAKQWLAAGRPDEARRLLAMVQTQLVLQPVTPDAPQARGASAPAAEVGNAIRWLDIGAVGQATQAIDLAIQATNGSVGRVRAWSGYPVGIYSGYSQPYRPGFDGSGDDR
jgi:signal transduction histidine kinase